MTQADTLTAKTAATKVKQPTPEEIMKDYNYDPDGVMRISRRKVPYSLEIQDPDPNWPIQFESLKADIEAALGPKAICISHVGSTSVPGLPAKNIIDIDLTVADTANQDDYIPALESAGFQWTLYEPGWHNHHFLVRYEPMTNLHVFSEGCPELVRHQMFRNHILNNKEDRELYIKAKRDAASVTTQNGEQGMDYNLRKEKVIREILQRIWKEAGFIE
ncbi:GrpB domain-containing protein [Pochonia chlamydosporia 170]|uniref:GrpB domain-containing protein n=1 Tax=Pochonia chlamydosporia 170 TaxID=1380566 RepID=A0A179FHE8_METCM|nr:GrpB domain-containing protein [Pochonia chlamydosporia 170]OAQ64942.1 GrpB domain-containing protein [Pochonia chlamydosporia 170]